MSEVTRSTQAESAVAASYAARRRLALPNGWWGAAMLVAAETALFGSLLASYYFLRFQTVEWPPAGIEPPDVTLPLVLTGALVLTSLPLFLAVRAARVGRLRAVRLGLLAAGVVQCGYLAAQIVLFMEDLDKFSPEDTAYGSIYFTLLAAHHLHVLVGILLVGWLLVRLIWGLTNYRLIAIRVVALYWNFVNALAILVVLTQLSPSL